jgi:SP family sugar:H+ symporter-like MFS transporter
MKQSNAPAASPTPDGPHAAEATRGVAILLAAAAAMGGFLFGYDSAVINGAVKAIGDQFSAAPGALGFTVSAALIGAAIGALATGRIADRYGRLAAMRVAAVLFTIGAVGSGLANSLLMLAIFRVVGGVAVGIASVVAPAYIAEISPADSRGRLGSLQQLAIVSGIFLSLLVDYAVAAGAGSSEAKIGGLEAWRWMFVAMVVPAAVYGVLSLRIPESPRHLLAEGKVDEARAVLAEVLGERGLTAKISQIRHSLEGDKTATWSDLRGKAMGLLPIVWIGIGLSVFQQFVGINVIFYYSSILWEAVGFSEKNSLVITVITSVVNVVTTLVAISLIDHWGRRPLLLVGSAGMAVTLGILAFVFGGAPIDPVTHTPHLLGSAGPIALIAANVYVFAFGMSWGPVVWVLLGEKFPNHIRAAALSVAAGAQWVANWLISTSFPILKNAGLGLAYGLYTAFAVLSFLFVLRFIKESKGRELEEMNA